MLFLNFQLIYKLGIDNANFFKKYLKIELFIFLKHFLKVYAKIIVVYINFIYLFTYYIIGNM